ncbi:MAG: hypothetical protein KF761_01250 [Salinibacterium sp.]|nr:hypothetical protein [Salinibacterium sp.]
MPDDTAAETFRQHARSFDGAAAEYERARPSYPQAAVDWLLESDPHVALDLGAGTGKFTRLLVGRVPQIIAVDPAPRMLGELEAALPKSDDRAR